MAGDVAVPSRVDDHEGELVEVALLVVHSAAAVSDAGGRRSLAAGLERELEAANRALALSCAGVRLRMVGLEGVAGAEDRSAVTTLAGLADRTAPRFPEVHEQRARHCADLVCLITGDGLDTHGKAYLMSAPSVEFAPWAFSVVRYRALGAGEMTFAHEIAHNFGCDHDVAHVESDDRSGRGHGHRFAAGGRSWRTILALTGGALVPHFSSPRIWYSDVAAGDPERADNARVLRDNAAIVARFGAGGP